MIEETKDKSAQRHGADVGDEARDKYNLTKITEKSKDEE